MYAYHFIKENWKSGSGSRRKPWVDGAVERHKGYMAPCQAGLHSSPTPWDALQYAPGPLLSLVEIPDDGDDSIPHGDNGKTDKYVSRWRRRIKTIDVSKELRLFACDVAEEALNREVQAGRTVDERSRAAIEVARRFAAGQATINELETAWAAAKAAGDAAWAADSDADRAAWAAAKAAGDAAKAAAKAAVRAEQVKRFNAMIEPLFEAARDKDAVHVAAEGGSPR